MRRAKRAKTKRTVAAAADALVGQPDDRWPTLVELPFDVYWEQDQQLRFAVYRPRDAGDAGSDAGEVLGKTLRELCVARLDGDATWTEHDALLGARQPFHNVVVGVKNTASGVRYLSFSGQPAFAPGRRFLGYRGIAVDVTIEMWAVRLQRLEHTIARILLETDGAPAFTAAIRAVCESEDWEAGNFWSVQRRTGILSHGAAWRTGHDSFVASVLAGCPTLPDWLSSGEPVWIADIGSDHRTPRVNLAQMTGWNAALLVPVKDGPAVEGVLEFYAASMAEPDLRLLDVLRTAGARVGRFARRMALLEHLREEEDRFSSTIELAAIGIAHVDPTGRFVYVNPQLCDMLQYREHELLGLAVKDISHPDDASLTDESRDRLRAGAIKSFKVEKRYIRKDRSVMWVALTIAAKRDRFGNELYDVSIVEDISARKSAEERVQYLATHDGLTGLPNRVMFAELLNIAVNTARRNGSKVAVLFIDLDRFKVINDTLGHEAGDALLREVASRFRENLRASDIVARLGGDEFVILVQDAMEPNQVAAVARSILSAAIKPVLIGGSECRVTASIGICVFPDGASDSASVMKNADLAMYAAKEDGKNNYRFYTGDMKSHSVERLTLETNLRRALERNEFSIHYQAKVDARSGAISGVEALLRWNNEELGAVSPATFIPLAEEMGLIVPIGLWVLETACAQSVAWQREGLQPICLSVNLSIRQLHDENLVGEIAAVLEKTGLEPGMLELEITESMIMQDSHRAIKLLTAIKALGVRLAIDDFGTGYSSLAQLKQFPIDTLKVDRSFIREIPRDAEDRAITEAIIAMGKSLSLTIVAEGVETPEQRAFLQERSCDELQGFYFSHPIPPDDFALMLRNSVVKEER